MGWAFGENNNGRQIGYGVEGTCDWPDCEEEIDLGVGNCCGGLDGTSNAGMDGESYCGDFLLRKAHVLRGVPEVRQEVPGLQG